MQMENVTLHILHFAMIISFGQRIPVLFPGTQSTAIPLVVVHNVEEIT
jgi:hypothetical protein